VRVNLLVYSSAPERRSVALTFDGWRLVTLHEGESANDVEVERILADRVVLRHAGRVFSVLARN
jgi:hypothetical protein